MCTDQNILQYLESLTEPKKSDMQSLHALIMANHPDIELSFESGKNADNVTVSNPSIGYGSYLHQFANGQSKPMYLLGISANTSGISLYCLNLKDKNFLMEHYGQSIGKAKITGYCIKFKRLKDLDKDVLLSVIRTHLKL